MSTTIHLAVDTMSGDHGLRSSIPASIRLLQEQPDLHLHLVGDETSLQESLSSSKSDSFSLVHCDSVVPMDASVKTVLRDFRKDSSMQMALELVASGSCQGVVSAGNTAALMALAIRTLGLQEGISRPALCASIPTLTGRCFMLDLGANVDCSAEQLVEFAGLGQDLVMDGSSEQQPSIGLLSNGTEAGKGNEQSRRAFELLQADDRFNFVGNIEASLIQQGAVDVLVCDGFAGNVALKAMEGTGLYLQQVLRTEKNPELEKIVNPQGYNGALLLGLKGSVVKSHGGADRDGFHAALLQALQCIKKH